MFSAHSAFGKNTGLNNGVNAGASGFEFPPVELSMGQGPIRQV